MRMMTAHLERRALDYAVAMSNGFFTRRSVPCPHCNGEGHVTKYRSYGIEEDECGECGGSGTTKPGFDNIPEYHYDNEYAFSCIKENRIALSPPLEEDSKEWFAHIGRRHTAYAKDPCTAVFRCLVQSKSGGFIDIPTQFLEDVLDGMTFNTMKKFL